MPHNLPPRRTNISVSSSLCTDKVFYALLEDKVCRGVALMLLQNAVKFNLREFQEVWQQSVPEGLSTRLEQLKVRLYFSYILHSEWRRGAAGFFILCCSYSRSCAFWVEVCCMDSFRCRADGNLLTNLNDTTK